MADKLDRHIDIVGDPLRNDLMGQLIEALTTLSDEAVSDGGEMYSALYEFEDPEAIDHLKKLGANAHVILSNMPSGKGEEENQRHLRRRARRDPQAGLNVIDRFMPSGHIGHNKFQVLVKDGAQAVLFGSTNWTAHALCAQTNNSIVARSPALAAAYLDYWNRLKDDTDPQGEGGKARAVREFPRAERQRLPPIALEDGSGRSICGSRPTRPTRGRAGRGRTRRSHRI